jgi:hypothetical protein
MRRRKPLRPPASTHAGRALVSPEQLIEEIAAAASSIHMKPALGEKA